MKGNLYIEKTLVEGFIKFLLDHKEEYLKEYLHFYTNAQFTYWEMLHILGHKNLPIEVQEIAEDFETPLESLKEKASYVLECFDQSDIFESFVTYEYDDNGNNIYYLVEKDIYFKFVKVWSDSGKREELFVEMKKVPVTLYGYVEA